MIYLLAFCIGAMPVKQCQEPQVSLYSDSGECVRAFRKARRANGSVTVLVKCEPLGAVAREFKL